MYETLLVPTDGSPVAKAAGEYACALARQFDADVYILSVEDPLESDEEGGERAVAEIADLASEADLEVTTEVIETEADTHETIIDYAADHDVDCIVMGTHGRTGMDRFILGSVAEQTLRESPVPVVTVHGETDVEPTIDRVLVATDGSDAASAAVSHAADLAETAGAQLDLLYVAGRGFRPESEEHELTAPTAETGYDEIDEAAERAFDAGIGTVHAAVLSGRPDQVILAHAAERGADCVVVGTHGRTGLRRYLLGSTTERLVRFANSPSSPSNPNPDRRRPSSTCTTGPSTSRDGPSRTRTSFPGRRRPTSARTPTAHSRSNATNTSSTQPNRRVSNGRTTVGPAAVSTARPSSRTAR